MSSVAAAHLLLHASFCDLPRGQTAAAAANNRQTVFGPNGTMTEEEEEEEERAAVGFLMGRHTTLE